MFKSVEDVKALLIPSILALTLMYSMYAGLEYSRDIIVAFIAIMTQSIVTKQ